MPGPAACTSEPAPLQRLLRSTPLVVTGCGVCSAAGLSPHELWKTALGAQSPAVWREFPLPGGPRRLAVCAVPDAGLADAGDARLRRMDRSARLAWHAAAAALRAAGLADRRDDPVLGVIVGTSRGPAGRLAEACARLAARRLPPTWAADSTPASLSGLIARRARARGPGLTVAAACASGAVALGLAAEQLLLGQADVMLAGAADAPLTPLVVAQLEAAGVLGSHPDPALTCRPFDETRNGLCLGEGAAFLVLETAEGAARRGARPLARLAGWGMTVDDSGRTGIRDGAPGLVTAMRRALAAAGLPPEAVDHVNAHGTGTPLNDAAEAAALREVFGARAASLPCVSTKPITGHCLGATPALEAVLVLEALARQIIPPTANCHRPDPACSLHVQPLRPAPAVLHHVMSNSLGFWGHHASLIFSRPDA